MRMERYYLVSSEEMRRCDAYTIETIGIPGQVLMERAALAARDAVLGHLQGKTVSGKVRVLILCGVGNNGGDGLALARLLAECGAYPFDVTVWTVGNPAKASGQWQEQRRILTNYPVRFCEETPREHYEICMDALFGVGLSRPIEGIYAQAIETFNHYDAYKIALDVPSGISSDTGEVLGCAARADATVTFAYEKRGLWMYPGREYAGQIIRADIGITDRSFAGQLPEMFRLGEELRLADALPRGAAGNKATFGKVLLIAGSFNMAGAAVLAARAAYRSGAGMVKVLTVPENREILQRSVPEALLGDFTALAEGIRWADVLAIGPGLGQSAEAKSCLETVLTDEIGIKKPLLIDADGLNLLAADERLADRVAKRTGETILTPHVGELARLLNRPIAELKEKLWEHGRALAERLNAVVVAKDARTYICAAGQPICMNIYGNSGMATAGSGDVLAGCIAGIWGQLVPGGQDNACRAAVLGVRLHAQAGDRAARELGEHACMAGDIADKVV